MRLPRALLLACLVGLPGAALADGAAKAHLCTGCHGNDGQKAAPGQAGIGGRPVAALVAAMQDYQHLRRLNPAMQVLLLSMSDQDINEVAEYFSRAGADSSSTNASGGTGGLAR